MFISPLPSSTFHLPPLNFLFLQCMHAAGLGPLWLSFMYTDTDILAENILALEKTHLEIAAVLNTDNNKNGKKAF